MINNAYPFLLEEIPLYNATLLYIYQSLKQADINENQQSKLEKRAHFHKIRKQQIDSINKLIDSVGQVEYFNYQYIKFYYEYDAQKETLQEALMSLHRIHTDLIIFMRNKIAIPNKMYPKFVWRVEIGKNETLEWHLHLFGKPHLDMEVFVNNFITELANYMEKKQQKQYFWKNLTQQSNERWSKLSKEQLFCRLEPSWLFLCHDGFNRKHTFGSGSLRREKKKI